jgi:hypothetical protein
LSGEAGESRGINCRVRCLEKADVARARTALDQSDTVTVPYHCRISGKNEELLLVSDSAAEELAGALGRFGSGLAVKIFAAVLRTELCECDIATLVGGEESEALAELHRLERRGFLVHRVVDGMNYYGAGNPPLRKFFLNRLTSGRPLVRMPRASDREQG